jgi:hypothetical protein
MTHLFLKARHLTSRSSFGCGGIKTNERKRKRSKFSLFSLLQKNTCIRLPFSLALLLTFKQPQPQHNTYQYNNTKKHALLSDSLTFEKKREWGFFAFQLYDASEVIVGRFRKNHEPAATANIASSIIVPTGNTSGMAVFTVSVATARAPPESITVTL